MNARTHLALPLALVASFALAACGKKDTPATDTTSTTMAPPPAAPAVSVTTIETGRRLGDNRRVTDTASAFGTRDTIYAVVVTSGSASNATLTAKWTFQDGQTVDSTSQAVAPTTGTDNTAVTEFRLVKATPWPAGTYRLEVMLDGRSVGTKEIKVGG